MQLFPQTILFPECFYYSINLSPVSISLLAVFAVGIYQFRWLRNSLRSRVIESVPMRNTWPVPLRSSSLRNTPANRRFLQHTADLLLQSSKNSFFQSGNIGL